MKTKYLIPALAFILLCVANIQCNKSNSNGSETKSTANTNKRPDFVMVNHKKYPVQTILQMNRDEIKVFIREVLDDEMPPDYQIPDYIVNGTNTDTMYSIFWKRYPEFAYLKADALLTEVGLNPDIYVELVKENKALRNRVQTIDSIEFAKQKEIMQQQKQNK